MNTKRIRYLILLLILKMLIIPDYAMAWNELCWNGLCYKWPFPQTDMQLDLEYPGSTVDMNSLAADALESWNAVPGSSFTFYYHYGLCDPLNSGDGVNCVGVYIGTDQGPSPCPSSPNWLGVMVPRINEHYELLEADVIFNMEAGKRRWMFLDPWLERFYAEGNEGYQHDDYYSFHAVALHEFGHALGLDHTEELSTLNTPYRHGQYNLWADDKAGVRSLYPDFVQVPDNLVVSNWKPDGHKLVRVIEPSPRHIGPGQSFTVEFTMDHSGWRVCDVDVAFYLSSNAHSSKSDLCLGYMQLIGVPPDSHETYQMILTMPTYGVDGDYYIGIIVDPEDIHDEEDENDNSLNSYRDISLRNYLAGHHLLVPGNYPNIQNAINAAVNGDEIVVQPGTYNERLNINNKSITIKSVEGPGTTIIDANGAGRAVTINNCGPFTVLDGFTLKNGEALDGAGIRVDNSSPVIKRCIIKENRALNGSGGGMLSFDSSPTLINNVFESNSAKNGAAMASWGNGFDAGTIEKNLFYENEAGQSGYQGKGGGLFCVISAPEITTNTFAGNVAAESGGGIYLTGSAYPAMMNNILSVNAALNGGNLWAQGVSGQRVIYSDIQDSEIWQGEGNINYDPLFVNPGNKDFRLKPVSPCVDTGSPALPNDPDGSPSDMGALFYEHVDSMPTYVCGNVGNQIWDVTSSPFVATCDIIVPIGEMLTIRPGVEVRFEGNYELKVEGRLEARGEALSPIIFTSARTDPHAGDWKGIRFKEAGSSATVLQYAIVQYAQSALDFDWSVFYEPFSRIILRNNINGIKSHENSSNTVFIDNSIFINNQYGAYWDWEGALVVTNSIFYGNTAYGIYRVEYSTNYVYSSYNDFWLNTAHTYQVPYGTGSFVADPLFYSPPSGNYLIRSNSPCRDAGDPASPQDPDGTRADIGVFAYYDGGGEEGGGDGKKHYYEQGEGF